MNKEKYKYIGDLSQLFRIENYRMEGGKKDGVRATTVANESGLNYTVIADRCMDIAYLSYKGINISYINPCGVVAPEYYDARGVNWLKSFTAGFLTTCGLNNIGNPCDDKDEMGLHGRIGNTPADDYCVQIINNEEDNSVKITGTMKESFIFGEKLHLRRTITSFQQTDKIIIEDEIANVGFVQEEYMQLYHFNIGYPFLSPDCKVFIPTLGVKPANQHSDKYLKEWDKVTEPNFLDEMCYFHDLKDEGGYHCVSIFNQKYQFGFTLKFNHSDLDKFIHWKNLSCGQYVMGLEPATNYIGGRADERMNGRIKTLGPLESIHHKIEIEFFNSIKNMKQLSL